MDRQQLEAAVQVVVLKARLIGVAAAATSAVANAAAWEPYVEVTLDGTLVGRTPSVSCADRTPCWNYALDARNFTLGQILRLKVKDRSRQDSLIGQGVLNLSAASVSQASCQEDIRIYCGVAAAGPAVAAEPAGVVRVCLNFSQAVTRSPTPPSSATAAALASAIAGPRVSPALGVVRAVRFQGPARADHLAPEAASTPRASDMAGEVQPLSPAAFPATAGGGAADFCPAAARRSSPQAAAAAAAWHVEHQYWVASARRRHSVLCTSGLRMLLLSLLCCGRHVA